MNTISWHPEYGYWRITDQNDIAILAYIYQNGTLVRPTGSVEEYATADAAYAAIWADRS
jgi:hypothetical protein